MLKPHLPEELSDGMRGGGQQEHQLFWVPPVHAGSIWRVHAWGVQDSVETQRQAPPLTFLCSPDTAGERQLGWTAAESALS